MASLKNNINNISDDTESLVRDYLKLFSIKQTEKLSLYLGILATVFILSLLLLIIIVFWSFDLAGYLNDILANDYWGFWIVSGFYILVIALVIFKMIKTKRPPLSNLFVKLIVSVMSLDISQSKSLKGLKIEREVLNHKIETGKVKIKANAQSLRYVIMESLFREFFGLFKSKKGEEEPEETEAGQANIEKENNK